MTPRYKVLSSDIHVGEEAALIHSLNSVFFCLLGVAIFLLLFILTSFSVWLTVWGFASILLSFAWAYFVYHVAFGKAALGLLNLVSAFVIIGIGKPKIIVWYTAREYFDHVQISS